VETGERSEKYRREYINNSIQPLNVMQFQDFLPQKMDWVLLHHLERIIIHFLFFIKSLYHYSFRSVPRLNKNQVDNGLHTNIDISLQ
jgi:hypothetical protein